MKSRKLKAKFVDTNIRFLYGRFIWTKHRMYVICEQCLKVFKWKKLFNRFMISERELAHFVVCDFYGWKIHERRHREDTIRRNVNLVRQHLNINSIWSNILNVNIVLKYQPVPYFVLMKTNNVTPQIEFI